MKSHKMLLKPEKEEKKEGEENQMQEVENSPQAWRMLPELTK